MLRTNELQNIAFDKDDPWSQILSNCAWAIRTTASTITNSSPAQLVFGRDMLYDLAFTTTWQQIKEKRKKESEKNNFNENKSRKHHTCQIGDHVLISKNEIQNRLHAKREGPFQIVQVLDNGTIKIQKGQYTQRISIRRCTPFYALP